MAKKGKKEQKSDWLTTYSDLMTLLLVFFIILISFGEVKIIKTQIILSAFSGSLGVLDGGLTLESSEEFESLGASVESLPSSQQGRDLDRADSEAEALFSPFEESKRIRVVENKDGIVISLFSDVFFEQGSAKVKFSAIKGVLENVRILLESNQFRGDIIIEGHTDSSPYVGEEFNDNWDLSMNRALNVFLALKSIPSIIPLNEDKIILKSLADNVPIDEDDTPQGRAYNRRVDIVLKRN